MACFGQRLVDFEAIELSLREPGIEGQSVGVTAGGESGVAGDVRDMGSRCERLCAVDG